MRNNRGYLRNKKYNKVDKTTSEVLEALNQVNVRHPGLPVNGIDYLLPYGLSLGQENYIKMQLPLYNLTFNKTAPTNTGAAAYDTFMHLADEHVHRLTQVNDLIFVYGRITRRFVNRYTYEFGIPLPSELCREKKYNFSQHASHITNADPNPVYRGIPNLQAFAHIAGRVMYFRDKLFERSPEQILSMAMANGIVKMYAVVLNPSNNSSEIFDKYPGACTFSSVRSGMALKVRRYGVEDHVYNYPFWLRDYTTYRNRTHALSWTFENIDLDSNVLFVTFNVTNANQVVGAIRYDPEFIKLDPKDKLDKCIEEFCISQRYKGTKNSIFYKLSSITRTDAPELTIGKSDILKTYNALAKGPITGEAKLNAKRILLQSGYLNDSAKAMRHAQEVVNVVASLVVKDYFGGNKFITPLAYPRILIYNKLVGTLGPEKWKLFKTLILWATLIGFIGVILYSVFVYNIMFKLVFMPYNTIKEFLIVSTQAVLNKVFSKHVVSAGEGDEVLVSRLDAQVLLVAVMIILLVKIVQILINKGIIKRFVSYLCHFLTNKKTTTIKQFLSNVHNCRQCIKYQGKIPVNTYINHFRSTANLKLFPIDPEAKLSFKEMFVDKPPKPAVVFVGITFNTAVPIVHDNSFINIYKGLRTRSLLNVSVRADSEYFNRSMQYVDYLTSDLISGPQTQFLPICKKKAYKVTTEVGDYEIDLKLVGFEEYLKNVGVPEKIKRILLAKEKFNTEYSYRDLFYEAFVKKDKVMKITREPFDFEKDKPRIIHGCSWLEKALAGYWYLNYGNALKHCWHPYNVIWYTSGYTADVFSWWATSAIDAFGGVNNCLFFGSDFTTYEITQKRDIIERELLFYRKLGFMAFIKDKKVGRDLQKIRRLAKETAKRIFKFSIPYTRKSGQPDTSSGNSKNTGEAIMSYLKMLGLHDNDFRVGVLGDDNFTILKITEQLKALLPNFKQGFIQHCEKLGYIAKAVLTKDLIKCEFLSLRFYPVQGMYVVGKKPGRCLVKLGFLFYKQEFKDYQSYVKLFKGVLLSYIGTSWHVPFLRVYVKKCLHYLRDVKEIMPDYNKYTVNSKQYKLEPDVDTFAAFELVYGLNKADEHKFSEQIDKALENGLPFMLDSEFVDIMFKIDSEL